MKVLRPASTKSEHYEHCCVASYNLRRLYFVTAYSLIAARGRVRPSPIRQVRPTEHQTPRQPHQPEVDVAAFLQQLHDLIRSNRIYVGPAHLGTVYFSYFDDRYEEPFRVYKV